MLSGFEAICCGVPAPTIVPHISPDGCGIYQFYMLYTWSTH